jgi:hypothetical protein
MRDERVLYVRVRACVNKSGRLWIMSPPQFPFSRVIKTCFVRLMEVALTFDVYVHVRTCMDVLVT